MEDAEGVGAVATKVAEGEDAVGEASDGAASDS